MSEPVDNVKTQLVTNLKRLEIALVMDGNITAFLQAILDLAHKVLDEKNSSAQQYLEHYINSIVNNKRIMAVINDIEVTLEFAPNTTELALMQQCLAVLNMTDEQKEHERKIK